MKDLEGSTDRCYSEMEGCEGTFWGRLVEVVKSWVGTVDLVAGLDKHLSYVRVAEPKRSRYDRNSQ